MIMSETNRSEGGWMLNEENLIPGRQLQRTTTAPATGTGGAAQLSPDGRILKTTKRRSRASRKAPTTLFNTDATNFRAMVQQFTGAPSAATQIEYQETNSSLMGPTNLSFGLGLRPQISSSYVVQAQQFQQYSQNQGRQFFYHGGERDGGVENDAAFISPQGGYGSGGMSMDGFPSRR